MGSFIDLTGKQFERLTVIKRVENQGPRTRWLCECTCGNKKEVNGQHLRQGTIQSCGCYNKEISVKVNTTHGMHKNPLYRVWASMIGRCCNPMDKAYSNYGGRGIAVCDKWQNDFLDFYNWSMTNGYEKGLTIDRINVNGNYEPKNCRWVDRMVQANNTRKNKLIEYNGKTQTLQQWCREIGIDHKVIEWRLDRGWTVEQALFKPVRKMTRKTP